MTYFDRPLEQLYDRLREHYRKAILAITAENSVEHPSNHLADHVMLLYLKGMEELVEEDSLVKLFFANAPSEVRAKAIWFLGRVLENDKPNADSELWERFDAIWNIRAREARERGDKDVYGNELSSFAWWLRSIPVVLPQVLELIETTILFLSPGTHEKDVLEYLASNANKYPDEVATLLGLMIDNMTETWFFRGEKIVREILQTCITSGNKEARAIARQVIDKCGELGDYSNRDLLEL